MIFSSALSICIYKNGGHDLSRYKARPFSSTWHVIKGVLADLMMMKNAFLGLSSDDYQTK